MSRVDLAIVGGYGDVGAQAARQWLRLRAGTAAQLRIGGRDHDAATRLAATLAEAFPSRDVRVSAQVVDVFDPLTLHAFVDRATAVLNCAGPAHRVGARVTHAALRAGADVIDAASAPVDATPGPTWPVDATRRILSGAGMQPGLSGLLPRWLAGTTGSTTRLTSHISLLDRFTATAADDFLQGGIDGSSTALAAWRDGPRLRALRRLDNQRVPGFSERLTLLPYLDREGAEVAAALGLTEGSWYSAVEGSQVMAAFERAHMMQRDQAVADLRRASAIDLGGRRPRVTMAMQVDGPCGSRSVLLRAGGNAVLSGTFAAVASEAVLRHRVSPGAHSAAMALDPPATIAAMRGLGTFDTFLVVDGPAVQFQHEEEGAL